MRANPPSRWYLSRTARVRKSGSLTQCTFWEHSERSLRQQTLSGAAERQVVQGPCYHCPYR